jgi:hypothetical protein
MSSTGFLEMGHDIQETTELEMYYEPLTTLTPSSPRRPALNRESP